MTPDERDLDALLRQPTERLAPPEHGWEQITRRAQRRKWVKASLAVAAGVVVVVGAVPAMIAVRASNNNNDGQSSLQTVTATNKENHSVPVTTAKPAPVPSLSSAPAVPPDLVGFFPASVSFVSYRRGYAWGSIGSSPAGVIAQTTDGGTTWTKLAAPNVDNSFATTGPDADGQIRYASGTEGFVFGAKLFATTNAGESWSQVQAPGYIDDLEATHNHRVWALVRKTKDAPTVELFTAKAGSATLQQVTAVGSMTSAPGADSIAVNHNEVDVIAGSSAFWTTNRNGANWRQGVDPCSATSGPVQSALLTTLNLPGIFAACGYDGSGGVETKQTFLSVNAGKRWTPTGTSPAAGGYLQTFAAGDESHIIVGNSRGGAEVTTNGGKTWTANGPTGGIQLSFVGFINPSTIVGVGQTADGSAGAFATSFDSGQDWTVTNFGK
jgi:hypothetical protein